MMKRTSKLSAVLAALPILAFTSIAAASSHREAPAISTDPSADNCDVWAWMEPGTHASLDVVITYIPLEEPSGGPNFAKFSDDVLYELHVTKGITSLDDAVTYQFKFKTAAVPHTAADGSATFGGREFFLQLAGSTAGGFPAQTVTVTKVVGGTATVIGQDLPVAPPNPGPRTDAVLANGGYNDAYITAKFVSALSSGEGNIFAGPRDDGFYVDLGGIFDLANLRPKGQAQDGVAGFNVHAISLELPIAKVLGHALGGSDVDSDLLGVWASASRRKVTILRNDGTNTSLGPWQQVSRQGQPLINEAVIGIQDKDKYNRTTPKTDVTNFGAYFLNPVVVKDAEAVGIYTLYGVADASGFETNRTDIIDVINLKDSPAMGLHHIALAATGDVLRVDPYVDSGYPNGRKVGPSGAQAANQEADVTDVILSLALTKLAFPPKCPNYAMTPPDGVGDCVDSNDKPYLTDIPYLPLPWVGYNQGHGKLTNP